MTKVSKIMGKILLINAKMQSLVECAYPFYLESYIPRDECAGFVAEQERLSIIPVGTPEHTRIRDSLVSRICNARQRKVCCSQIKVT